MLYFGSANDLRRITTTRRLSEDHVTTHWDVDIIIHFPSKFIPLPSPPYKRTKYQRERKNPPKCSSPLSYSQTLASPTPNPLTGSSAQQSSSSSELSQQLSQFSTLEILKKLRHPLRTQKILSRLSSGITMSCRTMDTRSRGMIVGIRMIVMVIREYGSYEELGIVLGDG